MTKAQTRGSRREEIWLDPKARAVECLGWWLRRLGLPRPDAEELGFAAFFRGQGFEEVMFRGHRVRVEVILGPWREPMRYPWIKGEWDGS